MKQRNISKINRLSMLWNKRAPRAQLVGARTENGNAASAPCDVTDEEAYKAAIELTQKTYGRLDILINNAGFQHVAVIEDFPTAVYQKLINVMLVGAFIGIKYAFPIMKAQQFGRVINMASINGLIGLFMG